MSTPFADIETYKLVHEVNHKSYTLTHTDKYNNARIETHKHLCTHNRLNKKEKCSKF